jgi:hypothetical protein
MGVKKNVPYSNLVYYTEERYTIYVEGLAFV